MTPEEREAHDSLVFEHANMESAIVTYQDEVQDLKAEVKTLKGKIEVYQEMVELLNRPIILDKNTNIYEL